MMGRVAPVFVLATLLAFDAAAGADDRTAAQQAKVSYDEGIAAYAQGRFDDAVTAFVRAYRLDPAPNLLFNIAQAYWKNDDLEQALGFYRRYLEADPRTDNRRQVEERIQEIEKTCAARRKPLPTPRPTDRTAGIALEQPLSAPPSAPSPWYRRGWVWGAAATVVLMTAGTLFIAAPWRGDKPWVCSDCNQPTYPVPGN